MKVIDTRGMKCPKPIIETKRALDEADQGESFKVLTDSSTSSKNISKFLSDNGIPYSVHESQGIWAFEVSRVSGRVVSKPAEEYCDVPVKEFEKDKTAVVISSEFMGSGDNILGSKLMKSFLGSLHDLSRLPSLIVFYNSGVKLAVRDSEVAGVIRDLEKMGVEVLLCGTCIEHFGLGESIAAGNISNMYSITEKLSAAGKIIRP